MIAYSAISRTFQVEIRVIGQSDHCWLISSCFVVNTQFVIVGKLVCASHIQISGIAFFTIGRKQAKHQFRRSYFFYIPHLGIESINAAMQCVCSVVDSQIVFHTINFEFTILDAVCKTTTHSTKILFFLNHFVECIESKYHIIEFPSRSAAKRRTTLAPKLVISALMPLLFFSVNIETVLPSIIFSIIFYLPLTPKGELS